MTPGGQGGTLAVIHVPACVSGLDLGCGLGDVQRAHRTVFGGAWCGEGRGEVGKTGVLEGRVAGLCI